MLQRSALRRAPTKQQFREICNLMHLLDGIGGDAEYTIMQRGQRYHLDEVEEEAADAIAEAG